MRRRRLLGALPAVAASLAGCGEARDALAPFDPRRPTDDGGDSGDPDTPTAAEGSTDATVDSAVPGEPTRTPASDPFAVTVANDDPARRLVTVVVEHEETSFAATRQVEAGSAARFPGAVGPGTYRVVVETGEGARVEREWRARDPFRELRVRVDDGLAVRRVARCGPACPPLSRGGEATGYPAGEFDPRGRRAGSALRLVNDGPEPRRVAVAVAGLLDYGYDVPPDTVLDVPVPQRSDPREVRVETADRRVTHPWRMEATPKLRVDVDGRPTVACGPGSLDLRCLNDGDRPRDLTVRVVADGVGTARLALDPGEAVRLRDVVRTAGSYALVLETDVATAGFRWTTCPARGPVEVVVRPDGVPVAPALARTSPGTPG